MFHFSSLKYYFVRKVFAFNLTFVNSVIVQTSFMKESFLLSYPNFNGTVHIIPQPVPVWLLDHKNLCQIRPPLPKHKKLNLVYPAASYPHKNHGLLSKITNALDLPVAKLTLTISENKNPAPHLNWIHCCGFLSPIQMISLYSNADGLLFLSKDESYGFPLIEAMFLGLPIVCANLPYAHCLCGSEAIYFEPDDPTSLKLALDELAYRLEAGWRPDWTERLDSIPDGWNQVADMFLSLTFNF